MDAEFWVALGFVCFILCAMYYGAHSRIGTTLDARAKRIRAELDEAERLRKEAAEIVEQARAESELIAKEAGERLTEFVRRRTAQAEAKIANAEVQALAQVRSAAADAATQAAATVLRERNDAGLTTKLLDESIADIRRLAH